MDNLFKCTRNTRSILDKSFKYIRSDVPIDITEDERLFLLKNDITVIIDLRTDEERAKKECPLEKDERFKYFCLPVTGGNAVPQSTDDVSESYINMVDESLKKTIEFIINCKSNVLYFCNAGKDRTGVVSAILLHKSGMSRDCIIDDYMKSGSNLKDMLELFAKQNPEVNINVITPHERYIDEFLNWYILNEGK